MTRIEGAEKIGETYASSDSKAIVSLMKLMQWTWSGMRRMAVFIQKFKITDAEKFFVSGYLRYMCCDDKSCLPPSKEMFSFGLEPKEETVEEVTEVAFEIGGNEC